MGDGDVPGVSLVTKPGPPGMEPMPINILLHEVGKKSRIWLGDRDITRHVVSLDISTSVDEMTHLILELVNVSIQVEGKVFLRPDDLILHESHFR